MVMTNEKSRRTEVGVALLGDTQKVDTKNRLLSSSGGKTSIAVSVTNKVIESVNRVVISVCFCVALVKDQLVR